MIEAVSELPTLVLIILLVSAFVVAFKIMEMVFETIMVSALSGVFYIGLAYVFGSPLTLDKILLFAFLGSTLYMLYSFLASAYTIFSKLIGIPYRLIKATFKYLTAGIGKKHGEKSKENIQKKTGSYLEKMELFADKIEAKAERSQNEAKEEERDVKEVVLDKVKEDSKEDKSS